MLKLPSQLDPWTGCWPGFWQLLRQRICEGGLHCSEKKHMYWNMLALQYTFWWPCPMCVHFYMFCLSQVMNGFDPWFPPHVYSKQNVWILGKAWGNNHQTYVATWEKKTWKFSYFWLALWIHLNPSKQHLGETKKTMLGFIPPPFWG